jgi:hypothetical protein
MSKLFLDKINKLFTLTFFFSIIILSVLYIFNSGLPQPGYIVAFISSLILIFINHKKILFLIKMNKIGLLFFVYCIIINLSYYVYFKNNSFLYSTFHWIYGLTILATVLSIKYDDLIFLYIKKLIISILIIISLSYLLGFGAYTFWPRYQFLFNGPNQLGYYLICIGIIYLVVTKAKIDKHFFIVYGLLVFCSLSTGGRSVYIGLFIFLSIFIFLNRSDLKVIFYLLLISSFIVILYSLISLPVCKSNIASKTDSKYSSCLFQNNSNENDKVFLKSLKRFNMSDLADPSSKYSGVLYQLDVRGYLRFINHPQYLFFGAGQGFDERFDSKYGYEVHSSVASVIFYYGICGSILFFIFVWKLFVFKVNLVFLLPIFFYGFFTYGLRSPFFWLTLGFVALPSNLFSRK